jgi:hypothetical protein
MLKKLFLIFPLVITTYTFAQDETVEEVITVGSQIKGASITGALPVTVAYSEISFYQSKSEKVLYAGTNLGLGSSSRGGANTQPLLIPSTNYWLNLLTKRVR